MADFFNNPMPTSGAHFVENPAKVTVERIARAIEYDADLADKYRSGTFFSDASNIRRAFELSRSFRDGKGGELRKLKAKLQKPVSEGGMGLKRSSPEFAQAVQAAWGGQLPTKHVKVGDGGRKAIAAAIGRARGFVKTNIRNRGRYLRVYGGLEQVKAKGIKQGAIKTRKWGSNVGLKGWNFADKPLAGAVYGRNREGGSLMKFKMGASSASAFKKEQIAKIRKDFASEIRAAGGKWWDVPAAKQAYESAVKGRRHSEHLSREQSDARMFARFGAGNLGAAYAAQAQGVDGRRIRSRSTLGQYKAYETLPFGRGRGGSAPVVVAETAVVEAPKAPRRRRGKKTDADMPVSENPFGMLGYDELGESALQNPTGIGFLDSVESSVANVPVVGTAIAPIVAPAALGAAAAAVHILVVPRLQHYLPEWAQPYSYSIGGAAVGIVSGLVAARATDSTTRTVAGLIGGSAVAIGLGIDAYRKFVLKSDATGDLALSGLSGEEMGDLALSGDDDMGDLALSGLGGERAAFGGERAAFGDGGAYQVQTLGFAGDHSALTSMYADASAADAYFSGPDLDGVEGEAVLAGPSQFLGAFGASPVRAAGQKRIQSRHAGLRGHRWGWAIKLVGFENFQKIAALPPEQRVQVIKQLREQAMASVQRFVDESKAAQLASHPVTAPDALSGYGTGMFSGGSY